VRSVIDPGEGFEENSEKLNDLMLDKQGSTIVKPAPHIAKGAQCQSDTSPQKDSKEKSADAPLHSRDARQRCETSDLCDMYSIII
jgi:hypothetical protein